MDVKTLCLGVLTQGEASGYDIKKHFECTFSHFFVAGFGSIYPALAELTRNSLVTCECLEQSGKPDRKVYRITDAGLECFRSALADTHPRHKVRSEFLVLLYFAHLLPPEVLAEKIDARCSDICGELAAVEQLLNTGQPVPPGIRFGAELGRVVMNSMHEYLLTHRDSLLEQAQRWQSQATAEHTKAIGGQS